MKAYKIEITETLQQTIEVEAEDENDALENIKSQYNDGDIVLDSDDFIDVEIEVV